MLGERAIKPIRHILNFSGRQMQTSGETLPPLE